MKKYILLLFLISLQNYSQEIYQKVNIKFDSEKELNQIIEVSEIDHFHRAGNYITCEIPKSVFTPPPP